MVKAIYTFAKANQAVQVFADSAPAVFILQKRYDRKSDHSQGLIIALDLFCRDHGISVYFTHVPRTNDMIQVVESKGIKSDALLGEEEATGY